MEGMFPIRALQYDPLGKHQGMW